MSDNPEIDFKLYRYTPNVAAAAIFVVLFAITTLYHVYQLYKARAWYFIAFVVGGICKRQSHPRSLKLSFPLCLLLASMANSLAN